MHYGSIFKMLVGHEMFAHWGDAVLMLQVTWLHLQTETWAQGAWSGGRIFWNALGNHQKTMGQAGVCAQSAENTNADPPLRTAPAPTEASCTLRPLVWDKLGNKSFQISWVST